MSKGKAKKYDPADEHDALFEFDADAQESSSQERQARVKSVAFAVCPDCSNEKVGLVPSLSHLMYREHYRVTTFGARLLCRASGATLCVHPPTRPMAGTEDIPACKHLSGGIQRAAQAAAERAREASQQVREGDEHA